MKKIIQIVVTIVVIATMAGCTTPYMTEQSPVDLLLLATRNGILIVDSGGKTRLFKEGAYRNVEVHEGNIYIPDEGGRSISVWDFKQKHIRTIAFPDEVDWLTAFCILPDERIAILDNNKDRVQFLSSNGIVLHTVRLRDKEDAWRQNMKGVVIDNHLVVIEDNGSRLELINLADYSLTIFPDGRRPESMISQITSHLLSDTSSEDPTLPKIIKENVFYTSWKGEVFEVKNGKGPERLIYLPEGNVTAILADNKYVYMCLNFAGKVYRLDRKTGHAEVFAEGIVYPCDMKPMPGVALASTRPLCKNDMITNQPRRKKAVSNYSRNTGNERETVQMFEQASNEGDNLAKMWLARFYFKGRCGLPIDPSRGQQMAKTALPDVRRLADKKDAEAEYLLGSAYDEGLGVSQDYSMAAKYYTMSAETGFALSMLNLGWQTMNGNGVAQDIEASRRWYEKAALAGSATASENLYVIRPGLNRHKINYDDLNKVPLIWNLWNLPTDDYLEYLRTAKFVGGKPDVKETQSTKEKYTYRDDGLVANSNNGFIKSVELYADGVKGFKWFRGSLPDIINWKDTPQIVINKLGEPDNRIPVINGSYRLLYLVDNIEFVIQFYSKESTISEVFIKKRWR